MTNPEHRSTSLRNYGMDSPEFKEAMEDQVQLALDKLYEIERRFGRDAARQFLKLLEAEVAKLERH